MSVADVKWIKITTDMFDNRKVKHLRKLPDGNNIVLIWVMLLTMAGRCNANGMIFLTENIPYTPKMLADELDFEENTVKLALNALEQLNMVVTDHGFFTIAGWEEYQNVDRLTEIREYNRLAKQKSRAKQKELQAPSEDVNDMSMTSQRCQGTEEDKEEEKELDLELEKETRIDYQQVVDLYNSVCKSFPSVRSLSEARKKAIKARMKTYTMEDLKKVFQNAEASSFLKGKNDRNWSANFDWMIADKNIAKILEGNYADKPSRYGRKEMVPSWCQERKLDDDEIAAINRMMNEDKPDLTERVELLKQRLQGG